MRVFSLELREALKTAQFCAVYVASGEWKDASHAFPCSNSCGKKVFFEGAGLLSSPL
jgi:hypothetical protein